MAGGQGGVRERAAHARGDACRLGLVVAAGPTSAPCLPPFGPGFWRPCTAACSWRLRAPRRRGLRAAPASQRRAWTMRCSISSCTTRTGGAAGWIEGSTKSKPASQCTHAALLPYLPPLQRRRPAGACTCRAGGSGCGGHRAVWLHAAASWRPSHARRRQCGRPGGADARRAAPPRRAGLQQRAAAGAGQGAGERSVQGCHRNGDCSVLPSWPGLPCFTALLP